MPILALMGLIQFGIPLILFARGALSVPAVTLSLIALLDVGLNPLWAWVGSVETPAIETAIGAGMIGGFVNLNNPAARFAESLSVEQLKMRAFSLN